MQNCKSLYSHENVLSYCNQAKAWSWTECIIIRANPYEQCFGFIFFHCRGMKKRNSFHNNDSSISCRGRLWASKWACKSYKNTLAETILWREVLLMTAGFIKGERENWMGLLSYCYAFSLSLIPLQRVSLHKPWITDLSGITSMSLHCLPSSQRQRGAIIRLSLQWDVKQC